MVVKYYSILWKTWRLFFPFPNTACINFRSMSCSLKLHSSILNFFLCSSVFPLQFLLNFLPFSLPWQYFAVETGMREHFGTGAECLVYHCLSQTMNSTFKASFLAIWWFLTNLQELPFLRTKSGLNCVANFKVTFGRLTKMHRKQTWWKTQPKILYAPLIQKKTLLKD